MTELISEQENMMESYTKLASSRKHWPNKYDFNLQLSKMLCDYALLSKANLRNKKVLNIGCSEPVDELHWIHLISEWHALDINEAAIQVAQYLASNALPEHLFSKLKFMVGDATALDLDDESYDVVVSFSAIDHITGSENRRRAVDEMCRVLKKGGYLVLTVPNKWDVVYSHHSNKLQKEGKAIFGYEYQFSPLELKRMIKSNGLTILESASTSYNPLWYPDQLLKKIKVHKLKIYFGTRFGFLAQK